MADPLIEQLTQRAIQPQDPQSAWQKASSIGADPRHDFNNPDNWKVSMMPIIPGSGLVKRILELLGSTNIKPSAHSVSDLPTSPTLGEHLPEFTPVGGEGIVNAARAGAVPKITNPIERVYTNILMKGGR